MHFGPLATLQTNFMRLRSGKDLLPHFAQPLSNSPTNSPRLASPITRLRQDPLPGAISTSRSTEVSLGQIGAHPIFFQALAPGLSPTTNDARQISHTHFHPYEQLLLGNRRSHFPPHQCHAYPRRLLAFRTSKSRQTNQNIYSARTQTATVFPRQSPTRARPPQRRQQTRHPPQNQSRCLSRSTCLPSPSRPRAATTPLPPPTLLPPTRARS